MIQWAINLAENIYLFKFNNSNTGKRCKICSKLTLKTPQRRHVSYYNPCSNFFREYRRKHDIVLVSFFLTLNILHTFLVYCFISLPFLVFLLLILSRYLFAEIVHKSLPFWSPLTKSILFLNPIMYLPLLCTKCFFLLVTIAGTK